MSNLTPPRHSPLIAPMPWSLDATKLLFTAVVLYLTLSMFLYPYGFRLVGTAFFRFGDFVALLVFAVAALLILLYGRIRGTILIFWPVLPLLVVDMLMPLAGVVLFGATSGINNALRTLTLHALVLTAACFADSRRLDELLKPIIFVLKFGLLANLVYVSIQIGVSVQLLPESLLITRRLEMFSDGTVREHFLRPSGFFRRAPDIAEFGVIGLGFFAARFKYTNRWSDMIFAVIGIVLVLLSTSRATLVAVAVILLLFFGSYLVQFKLRTLFQIGRIALVIVVVSSVFLWWLGSAVDTERYFARVARLGSAEITEDRSLLTRTEKRWPYVLDQVERKYPYGTLINPHDVFGPVDSGFLFYYVQGRWLGLVPVLWLFAGLFYLIFLKRYQRAGWTRLFLLYLAVHTGTRMIVSVALHQPVLMFWLYLSLWLLYAEEQGYLTPLSTPDKQTQA